MPKRKFQSQSTNSSNSSSATTLLGEGIADPTNNDILGGRGDTINRHPGNVQFRRLVNKQRRVYLVSQFKREKRLIAESIVAQIEELDPPGRFLSKNPRTGLWHRIAPDRAVEKTAQVC